ncbi:FAD-binding oxidoreductase [Achromobacter sp. ES-001]|uniref:NAD(P)/FAD-dependent oxidoreductase n=1 Tax=Achromobacter sp. ES-001 TaxID=2860286 RepID=UPI001C642236|nr:FAD-binding oxidoreductase [Achromobacter sp. ES-001]QYJ24144.1 FAD-binding oxidoreductase [Achromobacter sp. ES-001]
MQRVVIIGGGAVGSSIAYFLSQTPDAFDVTVLERDPTYAQASSALSASSIRQQFSTPVNIGMSQMGIAFLRDLAATLYVDDPAPDIGLTEPGYLYLASAAGCATLRSNYDTQRSQGVDVALLEPVQLQARFPWLNTADLALGALGLSGEGWFDGYGLMQALRKKAIAQGATYRRAQAVGLLRDGARVNGVWTSDGAALPCDVAVNAAGPWAARVAQWAGIALPVRARRRTVFSFSCPQALPNCPLLIDPSGIWFRPDGDKFLCGYSPDAADDADDLPLDAQLDAFDNHVWPALAARVPAFEAVRVRSAWAGYYEMNVFDHNAIIGAHPDCPNLYFANGFSGHGLQQAPATGRGIAELLRYGAYRSLDLSALSFQRVLDNRPLLEKNII